MSGDLKKIDIKEFRELGFLQEANRKFFHPLGLALEVIIEEDGTERLGGVWDYRKEANGILFGPGVLDQDKIDYVETLRKSKIKYRKKVQDKYDVKTDKSGVQTI